MLFPILLLVGGFVSLALLSRSDSSRTIETRASGASLARPCLARLVSALRRGDDLEEWMIDDAMAEAYDAGDWKMVAKLHHRFGDQPVEGETESENPNEPPDEQPAGSETVIGKSSPFEGIPNDAWDRFVSSLETQPADYQAPKHIGRFHHSRERLAQLKIDDVSTAEKQYDALVADLVDAREKASDLIREFEFQPITIDGHEHAITLSGILAVLKAAGLDHARSWFVHAEDRTKFPKTTEMFSKANGAF